MYRTYGETMLWVDEDEDLFEIFVSCAREFDFLPQYLNITGNCCQEYFYDDESFYLIQCYESVRTYENIYTGERTFYILDVIDENSNMIISLLIPDFAVMQDECEYITECLYQNLLCLIYQQEDFRYATEHLNRFWRPNSVAALSFAAADGNYIQDEYKFDWLYNHIRSTTPYDIDIIFSHYNDETRIFSGKNISMDVDDFISDLALSRRWIPKHDIWLWACDTGRPCDTDQYIAAQDIADAFGVEVEAPLGMIFVGESILHSPDAPNYSYLIVDLHHTEWYNRDWHLFENDEEKRFWNFLLANDLESTDGGWVTYIPD